MGSKLTQSKKCSNACRVFDNTAKKKITAFNHSYVVLWYLHSMIHNLVSTYFLLVSLSVEVTFHFLEIYFADSLFVGIQSFSVRPNYFIVRHTIQLMVNWHTVKKMLLFTNKILVLLLIYNFFILSSDLVSLNTICGLDFFRCLQILESHLQKKEKLHKKQVIIL